MRHLKLARLTSIAAGVILAGLAGPAGASGDYGCTSHWSLENPGFGCSGNAAISPGNDTRINLTYLLRDARGLGAGRSTYPDIDYWDGSYGHSFFDWPIFKRAFFPAMPDADGGNPYYGSRCVSYPGGTTSFARAVKGSRSVKRQERALLLDAREAVGATCEGKSKFNAAVDSNKNGQSGPSQWSEGMKTTSGQEFFAYLKAANAFYAEEWAAAQRQFGALARSKNTWVKETAIYMLARVAINRAIAPAFDSWGYFEGPAAASHEDAKQSLILFDRYLNTYPNGLYAGSAKGLKRRALWLAGDRAALAAIYSDLLRSADLNSYGAVLLIEEADNKLVDMQMDPAQLGDPLLVATRDLQMLRTSEWDEDAPALSLEDLEKQAPIFKNRPDLYSFLLANHAYYVAKDYRRVMDLIPDAARQDSFSPLQFSRQVLRGMALAQRSDRNESGFWMEVLSGADEIYQRPLVELALALNWERRNRVGDVFAKGSPITDESVRLVLAEHSAGPDLLRKIATDEGEAKSVRQVALFTLLRKQLAYGQFAGFLRDLAKVPADAPVDGQLYEFLRADGVATGIFTNGNWSDAYPCPSLKQTAATLAKNKKDSGALLCLGDFYRLNGFDYVGEVQPEKGELGSFQPGFIGKDIPRQTLYQQVLANRRSSAEQRAYALYRSVWCYGPGGNNSCGGQDVPKAKRGAWFRELKTRYASSPWAQKLKYYW